MPPKSLQGVPEHLKHVAEVLGGTAPKLVICYSEASPLEADTKARLEAAAKPHSGPVANIPSFVPTGGTEAEKKALAATEATLNSRKKAAAALSVPLVQWDCTPIAGGGEGEAQIASIRTSMGVSILPCLLALDNGELCDKLQGTADMEDGQKIANFISRFKEYCVARKERPVVKKGVVAMPKQQKAGTTAAPQSAPSSTNMTVDVDKMVKMGRDMIAKREPLYAEKFFLKALGVLDVAASEGGAKEVDENMEGSIAMTLAWVVIAQMLQSRPVATSTLPAPKTTANNCEACDRLERDFEKWITPASQCSLAVALREMFRYIPCAFDPKATPATLMEKIKAFQLLVVERSMAKVQQKGSEEDAPEATTNGTVLTDEEQKALLETRCQLVIIFLLSLDVERAVTEAVKINASGNEFGSIAIKAIKRTYLGDEA